MSKKLASNDHRHSHHMSDVTHSEHVTEDVVPYADGSQDVFLVREVQQDRVLWVRPTELTLHALGRNRTIDVAFTSGEAV